MNRAHFGKGLFIALLCLIIAGCGGARRGVEPGERAAAETAEIVEPEPSLPGAFVSMVGDPEQLTTTDYDNGIGSFHPDGNRITFQSFIEGRWQINQLDLTDLAVAPLMTSRSNDENPVWSPDGTVLLFVSDRDGGSDLERNIYLYSPEEDISTALVTVEGDDWFPVPLNDESFLFMSERDSDPAAPVMDKPNTLLQKSYFAEGESITLVDSGMNISAPAIIDSTSLVVRVLEGRLALYDLNSGESEVLTPSRMHCGTVAYSPVNGWLAFAGRIGDEYRLYLYDLEKRIYQPLPGIEGDVRYPMFSPDGKTLIYSKEVDGIFQLFKVDIIAM